MTARFDDTRTLYLLPTLHCSFRRVTGQLRAVEFQANLTVGDLRLAGFYTEELRGCESFDFPNLKHDVLVKATNDRRS
jgi:hypothetical protein